MADNTNLYSLNPGTAKVDAAPGAEASTASGYLSQAKDAAAQSYTAQTQNVDPSSLASNQLNDITKQDSPLMQRARQEGMLLAAKRGLQNSSIAAGASEGAMVDRATPLAQQNASQLSTQALANQEQTNAASAQNAQLGTSTSQLNAQLGTDVSKQNAALQTDVSKQNAQNQTETSRFNSETKARANEQNAAADNAMRQKVTEENAALNRQFLSGEQTLDLAGIQGKYQQLISSNAAAAQLYDSYFQGISATMANPDIDPARVAQTVAQQQKMLESGLALIQNMGVALGDNPGVTTPVQGAGSYNPGAPVQTAPSTVGSGGTVTTPESSAGNLSINRASSR